MYLNHDATTARSSAGAADTPMVDSISATVTDARLGSDHVMITFADGTIVHARTAQRATELGAGECYRNRPGTGKGIDPTATSRGLVAVLIKES